MSEARAFFKHGLGVCKTKQSKAAPQTVHEPSIELLTEAFTLTQREAEVPYWAAKDKTNRDIGLILNTSPRTVNKYLEHARIKLGVGTRTVANEAMRVLN